MVTACTLTPLFDALAALHQAHPGVELALEEDNSDRLINGVREGRLDLALVGVAGQTPAGLESAVIVSEGLVALVPAGHPLARRRSITLDQLAQFAVVCLPEGTGVRTVYDQAHRARGMTPRVALQASAPDAVVDLAARGLAVGVMSQTMAARYDLVAVRISDIDIPALLALVWSPSPDPALRELLSHCRKTFALPAGSARTR